MSTLLHGPLSVEVANAIYDILVRYAGAHDHSDSRSQFVYHQTQRFCPEYRFSGKLGFGGKFWRGTMPDRPIGYASCYSEDETPERVKIIEETNNALKALQVR